nr:hypothetical protein [Burkholderia cenocepacia]
MRDARSVRSSACAAANVTLTIRSSTSLLPVLITPTICASVALIPPCAVDAISCTTEPTCTPSLRASSAPTTTSVPAFVGDR